MKRGNRNGKAVFKSREFGVIKSLFLTVNDPANKCLYYVANDDNGNYSAEDMSSISLGKLMGSEGVLMDVGSSHESEKALVDRAERTVTFYFYLANERFFSIKFDLSYLKEKLKEIGAIE